MNDRMRSLLNVCGMPNEQLMAIYNDPNQTFYVEQFVKLIVRECARICSDLETTYAGGTSMSPDEIAKDTAESLAEIIKEHFRVE